MKKNLRKAITVVSLIIIMTALVYQESFAEENGSAAYSSDNIIIVYEDGTTTREKKEVLREAGLEKIETISEEENAVLAQTNGNVSVEEAVRNAEKIDSVAYAQPDFEYHLLGVTDDPKQSDQVHLVYTEVAKAYTSAWDYSTGKGVNICIIDSGLNTEHKEIKQNLKGTYNAITGSGDVSETEEELSKSKGHGMHVTGIAAAAGNNAYMGAGVAYDANIYFAKVFGLSDDGYTTHTSDIIKAYNWAIENKCRVVNMSFGGDYDDDPVNGDKVLSEKISSAYNRTEGSVLTVCAAGNSGGTKPVYPSDNPDSYSVTALDCTSGSPSYWNSSDHNEFKDIAAPGVGIYSLNYDDDGNLVKKSGTSMAAPMVTGTAALLLSINPDLSAKELAGIMNETSTSVTSTEEADGYGHGAVDALSAVIRATYKISDIRDSYTPLAEEKLSFRAESHLDGNSFFFRIEDQNGNTVKSLGIVDLDNGDIKTYSWDFRDEQGKLVTSGKYTLKGTIGDGIVSEQYKKTFTVNITSKPSLTGFSVTGSIQRNSFNKALIKYSLNNKTLVTTTITNSKGSVVRTYKAMRTGSITQKWDLRNRSGKLVPVGTYTVKIKGVNMWGNDAPVSVTGRINVKKPGRVKFASLKYTKEKKRKKRNKIAVSFKLTQDAQLTVRVYSVKTGKLVREIANGKVYRKGKRTVRWDLKSRNGKMVPRGKYRIKIIAKNSVGKASQKIKVRVR